MSFSALSSPLHPTSRARFCHVYARACSKSTARVQCTARVCTRARAADVHNQELLAELRSSHLGAQVYFGVSFFGQLKTSEVVAQLKTSLDDKSDNTRSHVQKASTKPQTQTPNPKPQTPKPGRCSHLPLIKLQTLNPKTPKPPCLASGFGVLGFRVDGLGSGYKHTHTHKHTHTNIARAHRV